MEKRASRVTEAQWAKLLEYLEKYPNLVKARGYNNSAKGRRDSARQWREIAEVLNAEGLGTTKTAKDWSVYVSNYKSKLKKTVADINSDATATGGGPPLSNSVLSDLDQRLFSIMGPGFGQATPNVRVKPFSNLQETPRPSTPLLIPTALEGSPRPQEMEKRASRVTEAQWAILLEYLEKYPNLVKARGYNNSAKGRRDSARQWREIAEVLNAEGLGTTKTAKDWSVYVSNYKSKLKKTVADINSDATATGGGPPLSNSVLSDLDQRLFSIMGPGFGQATPNVRVKPFSNLQETPRPSTPLLIPTALEGSPRPQEMEKRASRVTEAQWAILLEYLEKYPNLVKARGYNNSAKGRRDSARQWREIAEVLNAEGLGTTKTAKDWSVYVSNYKSKLKKTVADINSDATATGGGPPLSNSVLSDLDQRLLSIMGPGFGQATPYVRVKPFSDLQETPRPSTPLLIPTALEGSPRPQEQEEERSRSSSPAMHLYLETPEDDVDAAGPSIPRQRRQPRYRTRPLAPIDEARRQRDRHLSQVELQRAAADAECARGLHVIGQNLGRIASAMEAYISYVSRQSK